MKTFEHWQSEELELTFGLERLYDYEPLQAWLSAKCEINEATRNMLTGLRQELIFNADYWNEDELKFFFISQVIYTVNFTGKKFKSFTQRPLSAKKKDLSGNEVELKGRVEFVVATGKQNPREPFFFSSTNTSPKNAAKPTPSDNSSPPCSPPANSTQRSTPSTVATSSGGTGFS